MSNFTATSNAHRTHFAFAWERSAYVYTGTPDVQNVTQYAGSVAVYGPSGSLVVSSAYDYTSDADATADEIVTGLLADLIGSDADTYAAFTGTATLIITMSRGYTAVITQTNGTVAFVTTGGASEQGTTPANAAAWVTEGVRAYVESADPSYIVGDAAVENVDLQARVHAKGKPFKGLPHADGGSIAMRLSSSGDTTHTPGQVVQTWLGRLLEHALGGYSRGGDTTIASVTNQFTVVVASATYQAAGQIVGLEDSSGKIWPAQIVSVSGTTVVFDRVQPWTITTDTLIHGAETCYPEQAALSNPQDTNYSTLSLLYQYGTSLWMAGAAHLALDSVTLDMGAQPKLAWTVLAAQGYPQGNGAPAAPTWTNTIQGAAGVQAVGRGTKLFLQTFGTTTSAFKSLVSASVTVGVPVLAQDSVTEDDDGSPGRIGYRTEPAETSLEFVTPLDAAEQTRWTAGTYVTATYFQKAVKGFGFAVHFPRAFMGAAPVASVDGINRWTTRLVATERETGTGEPLLAKLCIALY